MDATMVVYFVDKDGASVDGACTATVFEKTKDGYLLLTAAHCLATDEDGHKYKLAVYPTPWWNHEKVTVTDLIPVAKAMAVGNEDIAVLRIKTGLFLPTIPLGQPLSLTINSQIETVGISHGQLKLLVRGQVEQLHGPTVHAPSPVEDEGEEDVSPLWWTNLIVLQLPVIPGDSGSALIDVNTKKIVGVVTGDFGFKAGIAVPITPLLKELSNIEYKILQ